MLAKLKTRPGPSDQTSSVLWTLGIFLSVLLHWKMPPAAVLHCYEVVFLLAQCKLIWSSQVLRHLHIYKFKQYFNQEVPQPGKAVLPVFTYILLLFFLIISLYSCNLNINKNFYIFRWPHRNIFEKHFLRYPTYITVQGSLKIICSPNWMLLWQGTLQSKVSAFP